jgi:hypothetical protein
MVAYAHAYEHEHKKTSIDQTKSHDHARCLRVYAQRHPRGYSIGQHWEKSLHPTAQHAPRTPDGTPPYKRCARQVFRNGPRYWRHDTRDPLSLQ